MAKDLDYSFKFVQSVPKSNILTAEETRQYFSRQYFSRQDFCCASRQGRSYPHSLPRTVKEKDDGQTQQPHTLGPHSMNKLIRILTQTSTRSSTTYGFQPNHQAQYHLKMQKRLLEFLITLNQTEAAPLTTLPPFQFTNLANPTSILVCSLKIPQFLEWSLLSD